MNNDHVNVTEHHDASVIRRGTDEEPAEAHGHFEVTCTGPDGQVKWRDTIENVVCTEGKNLAFNTFLNGSGYTKTGPYMGLISSVSYSAVAATDTGAQINGTNGWKEAGATNAPTYTAPRPTCAWAAASAGAIALSAALAFNMTGAGTVKGCFILFGTGATSAIDSAAGTLWSSGLFTGGDKTVGNGDTINASYSTSM